MGLLTAATASRRDATTTILVADDDPSVLPFLEVVVADAGFRVLAVESGPQALGAAEEEAIDLLVTDVVMPGMSGIELARRLREKRPTFPIVFVTGYADELTKAAATGPTEVLSKPFTPSALVDAVRRVLGQATSRPNTNP
jgi:CheY-like chemotaxis protein